MRSPARAVLTRGADNGWAYQRFASGCRMTMCLNLRPYHHGMRLDFSRPGKPTDNGPIETLNGSLRDECLDVYWFDSLEQAKTLIELWRQDHNESRPHMSLGNVSPAEFLRQTRASEMHQAR